MVVFLNLWDDEPERSGGDTISDDVTDIGDFEDPQVSDFEGEVGWREAILVKSPTDSVTLFQLPCKSFWAGFTTAGSVFVVDILAQNDGGRYRSVGLLDLI